MVIFHSYVKLPEGTHHENGPAVFPFCSTGKRKRKGPQGSCVTPSARHGRFLRGVSPQMVDLRPSYGNFIWGRYGKILVDPGISGIGFSPNFASPKPHACHCTYFLGHSYHCSFARWMMGRIQSWDLVSTDDFQGLIEFFHWHKLQISNIISIYFKIFQYTEIVPMVFAGHVPLTRSYSTCHLSTHQLASELNESPRVPSIQRMCPLWI